MTKYFVPCFLILGWLIDYETLGIIPFSKFSIQSMNGYLHFIEVILYLGALGNWYLIFCDEC